ncbi:hypothetical protein LJR090_005248 [Bosea sp. LjRoot90]|uniref:hypothetical protein n=1 Tax=Bosea sp. LjRoot90 TaxID=3342342 RepID=UPI003ECDEA89
MSASRAYAGLMLPTHGRHRELTRTWPMIRHQVMEVAMTTYEASERQRRAAAHRTGPRNELSDTRSSEIARDLLQCLVLLLLLAGVVAARVYAAAPF